MQPDLDRLTGFLQLALAEDIGSGDVTSLALIPPELQAEALLVPRERMVVCGLPMAERIFALVDGSLRCEALVHEGAVAEPMQPIMRVSGNARGVLTGERTALNTVQRMTGVATLTRRYAEAIAGTKAVLLDTRKTMPGMRLLDKYATQTGGAQNHRMGLHDMVLIKDNHIALVSGVAEAVKRARAAYPKLKVEVECDTLEQVSEAMGAGPDIIMLDNMQPEQLREAVTLVAGRIKLEASGGVRLETIREIAETGVDYISCGRLTHSATAVDIGLDIRFT
ncbi:carboxylating nicotinate-nucleotide diphosphorylase [bacterium]|nr:carboxylating nicotinate-nucleotide diphosphorylase [bacterium]